MSEADKEPYIRLNVKVKKKSSPELYNALVEVEENDRCERLRQLALLGYVFSVNGLSLNSLTNGIVLGKSESNNVLSVNDSKVDEKNIGDNTSVSEKIKQVNSLSGVNLDEF